MRRVGGDNPIGTTTWIGRREGHVVQRGSRKTRLASEWVRCFISTAPRAKGLPASTERDSSMGTLSWDKALYLVVHRGFFKGLSPRVPGSSAFAFLGAGRLVNGALWFNPVADRDASRH